MLTRSYNDCTPRCGAYFRKGSQEILVTAANSSLTLDVSILSRTAFLTRAYITIPSPDRKSAMSLAGQYFVQALHDPLLTPLTPWLQIRSSHFSSSSANEKIEVIDFDIKAQAWNPRLVRLESNIPGFEEMDMQVPEHDKGNEDGSDATCEEKVKKWLEILQAPMANSGKK